MEKRLNTMSSKSFQNASKLNGIVSVLQFGAVGDGVTDDTTAILSAIAYMASTGSNVSLPPGTYLSDSISIFSTAYAGQASFVGGEYAQAEYRNIEQNYGGRRSNMPYFGGLEPQAWTTKGILDFVLPSVAVTIMALLKAWIG